MRRLERLYAITEEIRRHEPASVSASWLADRFEVSRRTIERDLAALRTAGVPVGTERGRRGGYRLDPGASWTPVALNPAEMTALLLAQAASVGIPYGYAARSATAKLTDALPAGTRDEVARLAGSIRVITPSSVVDPDVQRAVEEAVRSRQVIRLHFIDRHGTRTERDVEPVGFYGSADGWSLIGWCRLRNAGRLFALDQIISATLSTELVPPRDPDAVLGWAPGPTSTP